MVSAQTVRADRFTLATGPCTVRSGSGAPAGGLGVTCDVYVDTATGDLYRRTTTGWGIVISATSGGQVGIGTAPSGLLHLLQASGNLQLILESTGTNAFSTMEIRAAGTGGPFIDFTTGSTAVATPDFSTRVSRAGGTDGVFDLAQTGTGGFSFSGGSVGIGTAPSHPLHVAGARLYLTNSGNTELMTTNTSGGTVTGGVQALSNQSVRVGSTTAHATEIVANNTVGLTLESGGDLLLDPVGNDVLPASNYDLNLGALAKKYLTLHAAELWVETLVAQNTIATIGGRVLVAPTTPLSADLAPADTTITVKYNQMASGDRIYLEADGKVELMAVTSAAGGSPGAYTYSVTRNLDGTGADQWYAGDAALNTGTTGDGFIDLYSLSGVVSGAIGPSIVGNVRLSATYNDISPRWALGNLNGLYGYVADTYGTAFGVPTAAWVKIDPTNGVRIGHNVTTVTQIDASGNASFTGTVTAGAGAIGGFNLGADYVRDVADSFGLASTVTGGDDVRGWAGATFANRATAPLRFTESGAFVATSATITGAITATSGSFTGTVTSGAGAIGGFNLGADYIRDAADSFGMASTVTGGDDVRWWAGAAFADRATAPYRVTEAGVTTAQDLRISEIDITCDGSTISRALDITSQVIRIVSTGDTGTCNIGSIIAPPLNPDSSRLLWILNQTGQTLGITVDDTGESTPEYRFVGQTANPQFVMNDEVGVILYDRVRERWTTLFGRTP